jgi:hypothetical protein
VKVFLINKAKSARPLINDSPPACSPGVTVQENSHGARAKAFARQAVGLLLLAPLLAHAVPGWFTGGTGCLSSFEAAKSFVCSVNNPDTTSAPG